MEGFITRLRLSLQRGRGVSLPIDDNAALNVIVTTIFANDARTLEDLISTPGFDVHDCTYHRTKRTLLLCTAYAGAFECMNVLLKKGVDVNQSDASGYTPFLVCCRNGNRKCVKRLITHPEIDIYRRDIAGLTGIHWLAASGRTDCLLDCLPYIKDIDILDEQGQTPLHVATKNGHIKVMEILIDNGADVNMATHAGVTPLHFACSNGQLAGLNLLLNKRVLYKPNKKGQFPIEEAIEAEHHGVIIPLMEKYENLLSGLVQLTIKDEVNELKLLSAMNHVLQHLNCLDLFLETLSEMATNAGLKLLTSFSIVDVELFSLKRCIFFLTELCKKASTAQIKMVKQWMADVWSSMEGWFNLLAQKISNGEAESSTSTITAQGTVGTQTDASSVKNAKNLELQTMCPRLSSILQAYYLICKINIAANCEPDQTPSEFLQFVSAHDKEIEYLISRDPSAITEYFDFILTDSQLNYRLFKYVKILPFATRKEWFYKQLQERITTDLHSNSSLEEIVVSRASLFTSSCHQLLRRDPHDLQYSLAIKFTDEEALGPGVVKEWFSALSEELLNPNYALFITSSDGCTFQPNPMSHVNPDHLNYFNFAGQVIGLALFHQHLIDAYFTRSFYKHILGIPVNFRDIESIDPEYFRNLKWILDNDITDLGLDLTFTIENHMFGAQEMITLKPGGDRILVTESNKAEYVQLVTEQRMTRAIQPQIDSFLQGLHKFVPGKLLRVFDEYELEMLLCGIPEIDVEDWKKHTAYTGYESTDQPIVWFWEFIEELSHEQKVQVLQFSTGSSRVPVGGFANLKGGHSENGFNICKVEDKNTLPASSTCVNMLKLPAYDCKDDLKAKLLISMNHSFGFGVV